MELKPSSNNVQSSTTPLELSSNSNSNSNPKSNPNPNPNPSHGGESQLFYDDIDSNCSTPYVSAPSSPGRSGGNVSSGFFYSAPASPMHFVLTSSNSANSSSSFDNNINSEFEFSARFGSGGSAATGPMSSADELFLNGKIRPMKLSTHLETPQMDLQQSGELRSGRDLLYNKSMRRRTRSLSPLRNLPFDCCEIYDEEDINNDCTLVDEKKENNNNVEEEEVIGSLETTPSVSASSSRSSSAGRNSKRWVFLKDFLHRSKSEGRSNNKFWTTISFSASGKEKKPIKGNGSDSKEALNNMGPEKPKSSSAGAGKKAAAGKPTNGVGKRRMAPSLHELHYTANRAQAEEMRKKTYLPYRQGLLGCLGFSSKGYGAAMSTGFARALNPVSSR